MAENYTPVPDSDPPKGIDYDLCHSANIAWRTGKPLNFDAKTETFADADADADADANK